MKTHDSRRLDRLFIEGKKYEYLKFQDSAPETGDYETCTFVSCDFSNTSLADMNFLECEFRECNLSLTVLTQTSFREVKFINCKLLGLHFEECNKLMISIELDGCNLDLCSFNNLKLKNTRFKNSRIHEADFTGTDLRNSSFDNCDLQRTLFMNANLEGADFRTSFNYSIDPELNRIKKAKFSLHSIAGLLDKYDIGIEK